MSNIRSPVHIKVAHENEFRRFLLTPVSYEQLVSTLKALFNLSTEEFRIKFQDDENDWVLLTTDQELVYATELSGSPLRLQIKLLETNTTVKPTCEGFKGRGGRGCRGGKGLGRGGCKSPEERLTTKSSRLAERINQLETKLSSEQLTSERERVIRWRLAKLQEKVAFLKAMKESLPASQPSAVVGEETTAPVETTEVLDGPQGCWGRGRRGRGCGGWRRAMSEDGEEPKKGRKGCCKGLRVDPELVAKFRQCKADLHAARESGDAEKINACLEAFKAAKAAKMEARAALRAQAAQACTDEERA
jgi:hypothetical protein